MALIKRCPVITIMGHVDHARPLCLIIFVRVIFRLVKWVDDQHIGAYQIMFKNHHFFYRYARTRSLQ
jgi:translation initiation factor IF-2